MCVEKLANAIKRFAIIKHLQAEDIDENEASLQAFSADKTVAAPDFTEAKENGTQMEEGSETEDINIEPASKMRRRQPKKWKISLEETIRHSGTKFMTNTKRIDVQKYVNVSCGNTCKLKCADRISETAIIRIHQQFWTDNKSIDSKRQFIV